MRYGLYPDELTPEKGPAYLLGFTSEAEFDVMSKEHMVVYFEKQDDDSLLCGLHALNNVTNCFSYKKDYLDEASRRLEQDIPENDKRQTQQMGDIAEGYYSSEVLKETVNKRFGRLTMQEMTPRCCEQLTQQNIPNYMVVFMQGNGDVNHFFSLTATFGERWILKDSALESPLMISKFMAFHLTKFMSNKDNTKFYVYTLSGNAPYDQKPTSVTLEYLKNYKKGKSHLSNYCWLKKTNWMIHKLLLFILVLINSRI